jgi:hypothetical protein
MRGVYDRARLFDIVGRSVEDIRLNEVGLNDLREQPRPGAPLRSTTLMAWFSALAIYTMRSGGLVDRGWPALFILCRRLLAESPRRAWARRSSWG